MVCHWEDTDAVAQEVFSNVRIMSRFPILLGPSADLQLSGFFDLYMPSLCCPHHLTFSLPPFPPHTHSHPQCISEIPTLMETWNFEHAENSKKKLLLLALACILVYAVVRSTSAAKAPVMVRISKIRIHLDLSDASLLPTLTFTR